MFDDRARIVSVAQQEHQQYFPKPGWVEHDPQEIWRNVLLVCRVALDKADLSADDLCALGIANQRETTVLWDRGTGEPVHNAINWQDTRTDRLCRELAREFGQDMFREKTGLPVTTYFSGPKIRWLLDNVPGLRERAEAGEVLFGTIDSWLIWNLCGRHVTDVTNASRTLLMNLHTLDWDADAARRDRRSRRRCSRRSGPPRRPTARPARRSPESRSPRRSATSTPRLSGRPASAPGRRSAPSGREASSCSTPAHAR